MLISKIAALLPLVALWIVLRRCFAKSRVLLYTQNNHSKAAANQNYLRVKTKGRAASPTL